MARCIGFTSIATNYEDPNWRDEEEAQIKAACERFAALNEKDKLAGKLVGFPIADGYALYIVASSKPLELVHVEVGDGWQIPSPYMRGLEVEDIEWMRDWRADW